MLHAVQPWLPLLAPEPPAEPSIGTPARKARRRPADGVRRAMAGHATTSAGERRAARQAFLGLVACWGPSAADALRLLGARRSLLLIAPEPAFEGASMLQALLVGGLPAIKRARAQLAGMARRL